MGKVASWRVEPPRIRYGIHGCAGQGLARLEAQALLAALVRQVERVEVSQPVRRLNNVIRGLESLSVTLVPA